MPEAINYKRPRDFARALALFLPILDGYDGTCYTFRDNVQ